MKRIENSAVFCDVLWRRKNPTSTKDCRYTLKVAVPQTYHIRIVGEGRALGDWSVSEGVVMHCEKLPLWGLPTGVEIVQGTEYKFVMVQGEGNVVWEEGENRVWNPQEYDLGEFRGTPQFKPHLAGVSVPVFSLRTAKTEGIGDFLSLGEFAEWAATTGMKIVQTLPVNDTTHQHTFRDSYPYSAISSFALHPLYIRVSEMDGSVKIKELTKLEKQRQLNYTEVDRLKWRAFRESYKKNGQKLLESFAFREFYNHNKHWLLPYSVFCWLRDRYHTPDYGRWAVEYQSGSEKTIQQIFSENKQAVQLHMYLQYHAHEQLLSARNKAHRCGVCLKGDVPIGVSRYSVDVWQNEQLFNLDKTAGAPPDEFSETGQNWGFPTYNWTEMAHDNYRWWRERFQKMGEYFDMYRIDHILGFFRIWEIPTGGAAENLMGVFSPSLPMSIGEMKQRGFSLDLLRHLGLDSNDPDTLFIPDNQSPNMYHPRIAAQFTTRYKELSTPEKEKFNDLYTHYFYHRHNDFWAGQALAKLPTIVGATAMLPCAEDLGMVPDCVGWVLGQLGIASLDIERMPKDPYSIVGDSAENQYLSVASTATHDMQTIREWWQMDRQRVEYYYDNVLGLEGRAPKELTPQVAQEIVDRLMQSYSFAVILPLSDYLAMDKKLRAKDPSIERINNPKNPQQYWQYRVHLSVEALHTARKFNDRLQTIINNSKR